MSGAGVLAGDALIGVVSEHADRRGPSDITVTPLDVLSHPNRGPPNASEWWERLGASATRRAFRGCLDGCQAGEPLGPARCRFPASGLARALAERDALRDELKVLLKEGKRIISVVGRRGVGKSGVVTRVLADFEEPRTAAPQGSTGRIHEYANGIRRDDARGRCSIRSSRFFQRANRFGCPTVGDRRGDDSDDLFDSLRTRRVVWCWTTWTIFRSQRPGEFRKPDIPRFLCRRGDGACAHLKIVTTSQRRLVLPPDVRQYVAERELHDGLDPETELLF